LCLLLQKTFRQYHHVIVCCDTIAHTGVLPHAITLQRHMKNCLVYFYFLFVLVEPFVNHRYGAIFTGYCEILRLPSVLTNCVIAKVSPPPSITQLMKPRLLMLCF
jgi:hypothetical protein